MNRLYHYINATRKKKKLTNSVKSKMHHHKKLLSVISIVYSASTYVQYSIVRIISHTKLVYSEKKLLRIFLQLILILDPKNSDLGKQILPILMSHHPDERLY